MIVYNTNMFTIRHSLSTSPNKLLASQLITDSASDIYRMQKDQKMSLDEMLKEIDEALEMIGTKPIPNYLQSQNEENDSSYSSSEIEFL